MTYMRYKNKFDPKNEYNTQEELDAAYKEQNAKRVKFQIATYALSYLFWSFIHV